MENPWIRLPEEPPYVLSDDRRIIIEINNNERQSENQISINLLPDPFIGNIDAPIILLTKCPGIHIDDPTWHKKDYFIQLMRSNYLQEPVEYPLLYLDEKLKGSPGAQWYRRHLKNLILDTSIKDVSRKICSVPIFPYHQKNFKGSSLNFSSRLLPSQFYTKSIIIQAMERKAKIIIMIGQSLWFRFVPQLSTYPNLGIIKNPQNPMISINNINQPSIYNELISIIKED